MNIFYVTEKVSVKSCDFYARANMQIYSKLSQNSAFEGSFCSILNNSY